MRDGLVEQTGTPLELYDRPANQYVTGFIGAPAMNFIRAEMTNDGLRLTCGVVLPLTPRPTAASTPLVFGIRPEDLQVVGADVPGAMRGTVVVVDPTGSETTVIVECEGGRLTAVLREAWSSRRSSASAQTGGRLRAYCSTPRVSGWRQRKGLKRTYGTVPYPGHLR